jgi:hypothetical protein
MLSAAVAVTALPEAQAGADRDEGIGGTLKPGEHRTTK